MKEEKGRNWLIYNDHLDGMKNVDIMKKYKINNFPRVNQIIKAMDQKVNKISINKLKNG